MSIFSLVFFKVLSSCLSVLIGFFAGRIFHVEKESITSLLFYFVAPIVFFAIPTSAKLQINSLGITFITFILASILGFSAYWIYGKIWSKSERNILALSAGTGNSGYVVLPIAAALFDDYTLSIYALGLIGIAIYEASVGCYFCARSINSFKVSVMKVVKLPILNSFFLGCALSVSGFQLPDFLDDFIHNMQGAYSILGMVVIGLALSSIKEFNLDLKFIGASFLSKFIFYPILFNMFIVLDYYFLKWYNSSYYDALRMLSIAPLATNTIVIASLYKTHPEKMATAVLFSLLFVLVYIPSMVALSLGSAYHP